MEESKDKAQPIVVEMKKSVGRPRIPDSQKAVYQRVPIRYETYKKLKELTEEAHCSFTELIEAFLQDHALNIKS